MTNHCIGETINQKKKNKKNIRCTCKKSLSAKLGYNDVVNQTLFFNTQVCMYSIKLLTVMTSRFATLTTTTNRRSHDINMAAGREKVNANFNKIFL